ncbi:MAG TPA: 4-hydroxy-3-methylbut-2-enyl diphosphate reductase [Myxococcota bacterium]|nr:4-hydroxy-3-methylbut-2-enyl diphosphate reductase [Myxococcota bacterium]HRY96131.1 4-hydroxy-3-methylbut-2-enyl diphosphate reductase [Myxococcota bacterium]
MKVRRLARSGFCYGVRRATGLAIRLRQRHARVWTLGPLMHNPQEVARLASQGILPCGRVEECGPGPLLVRTHGVAREEEEAARRLGLELVDGTCPHVLGARRDLALFGREGRTVILAGDAAHPEVSAQVSHAEGPVHVVGSRAGLPALPPATRVGVVAQTTLAPAEFEALVAEIRARHADTRVSAALCDDARVRQAEAARLAAEVDAVVVVGGRNSANTSRLAEICRRVQPRCFHVEVAEELRAADFAGVAVVGLAAGASTPDWLIEQVAGWLARLPGQASDSKEKSFDTGGQSQ